MENEALKLELDKNYNTINMKNKKTAKPNLLYLLLLLSLSLGCSKEEAEMELSNWEKCHDSTKLGKIDIEANSMNFISYPMPTSKVIFKDSSGQEYIGIVTRYNNYWSRYGYEACTIDSTINIYYEWTYQKLGLSIAFEELDKRVDLGVRAKLAKDRYVDMRIADICEVSVSESSQYITSDYDTRMSIIVNPRNHPAPENDYSDFQETYEIGGTTYNNVYIKEPEDSEDYEIYFNTQKGLLRFKTDKEPAFDLFFDRIE